MRERGTVATTATAQAMRTPATDTSPAASGLSTLPTVVSRSRSSRSLDQPMDSWPVSTAAATRPTRAAGTSADQATADTSVVTATVGPR
jgi:hypothetical protein